MQMCLAFWVYLRKPADPNCVILMSLYAFLIGRSEMSYPRRLLTENSNFYKITEHKYILINYCKNLKVNKLVISFFGLTIKFNLKMLIKKYHRS